MSWIVVCKYKDYFNKGFFALHRSEITVTWGIQKETARYETEAAAQAQADKKNKEEEGMKQLAELYEKWQPMEI